jgi:hypothetical protein
MIDALLTAFWSTCERFWLRGLSTSQPWATAMPTPTRITRLSIAARVAVEFCPGAVA